MSRQLRTLPQVLEERPWLTERFLRRLVAQKRIRYFKVRNRVLFDLDDLDDLAEGGRVEPRGLQIVGRRAGGART